MKLKKGDKVIVTAGKDAGKTGTIVRALPKENKVIVDGINIAKRHKKPTAANKQGQIVDRTMPIHASNVSLVDPKTGKATRIRIERSEKDGRTRVAVKSGQKLA
jgi:large subunit ribosomal protein L24